MASWARTAPGRTAAQPQPRRPAGGIFPCHVLPGSSDANRDRSIRAGRSAAISHWSSFDQSRGAAWCRPARLDPRTTATEGFSWIASSSPTTTFVSGGVEIGRRKRPRPAFVIVNAPPGRGSGDALLMARPIWCCDLEAVGQRGHGRPDPHPRRSSRRPGRRGLGQRGAADRASRPDPGRRRLHSEIRRPVGQVEAIMAILPGDGWALRRGARPGSRRVTEARIASLWTPAAGCASLKVEGRAANKQIAFDLGRHRGHHQGPPDQRLPQAGCTTDPGDPAQSIDL